MSDPAAHLHDKNVRNRVDFAHYYIRLQRSAIPVRKCKNSHDVQYSEMSPLANGPFRVQVLARKNHNSRYISALKFEFDMRILDFQFEI